MAPMDVFIKFGPLERQVYILASLWVEVFFYGAYIVLYALAMYVMTKGRGGVRTRGNSVFFICVNLMFLLTTLHVAFNMHRVLRAYGGLVPTQQGPIEYIEDRFRWDNTAHTYMLTIMVWLGDGLAVYRCWIVWNRSFRVIALPLLLHLASVVVGIVLWVWASTFFVSFEKIQPAIDMTYPLAFAQNVITTGLIALKIWRQHQQSSGAGLVDHGPAPTLLSVIRIIVESAALYTVQLLIIIVLYFVGHPAQWVVQMSMFPTTGMVFVVMAIRVHLVQHEEAIKRNGLTSIAPNWLSDTVKFNNTSSSGETTGESHALDVLSTGTKPRALFSRSSEAVLSSKAAEVSHATNGAISYSPT